MRRSGRRWTWCSTRSSRSLASSAPRSRPWRAPATPRRSRGCLPRCRSWRALTREGCGEDGDRRRVRRPGRGVALARVVQRLDQRARPAGAAAARALGARPGAAVRRPDPADPDAHGPCGGLPAVWVRAHRADLGVRRDGLQGALPLRGLPRAVRAREGDLVSYVATAFHSLKVADVEELTDDAVAVTFEVPDDLAEEFAFRPGQSLTLRRMVDGVEQRRQ